MNEKIDMSLTYVTPFLPEIKIDIISMLIADNSMPGSGGFHLGTLYNSPEALDTISESFDYKQRCEVIKSNSYFTEFFESELSPEIKIDEAVMDRFIKEKSDGFYCNVVKEDGKFKIISDNSYNNTNKFYYSTGLIQEKYINIIEFLKYVHKTYSNNNFVPIDLNEYKLGRKGFLKEFKNFIKIIPTTNNVNDFITLEGKIRDILLEEGKLKSMTHWDLHAFNKFFLSFVVEEDNLDKPYVKLYTRDSAEAAQMAMNLMDKGYVEILE
jgi:hypothetical protein